MEKAIRVVSIERGRDPSDFALVAFGGAGGLHACALAEALSIPHVIVPAMPGALSALGILASDVVKDYSRTVLWRVAGKIPRAQLDREFSALQKQAAKDFQNEAWQGRVHYHRSVDIRYRGQGYELNLPLTSNMLADFEHEHQRRYGYAHATRELELVTLRLRATLPTSTVHISKMNQAGKMGQAVKMAHVGMAALGRPGRAKLGSPSLPKVPVVFEGKKLSTAIYSRDSLQPGQAYLGPAIITEYSATTVIPPKTRFHLDRAGNMVSSHALPERISTSAVRKGSFDVPKV
jgi:N-methylhydantoinase A